MQRIIILCPIYNDQESFNIFAREVEKHVSNQPQLSFSFLVINDGSEMKPSLITSLPVTVVHLNRNIGHQKAIAIGLAYASKSLEHEKIIIMDCDGEDKPSDINSMIEYGEQSPGRIIFARRKSRQETKRFKFFYFIYKMMFRMLTGKKISFGNFMLLSNEQVNKIVYYSEIWNHVPGGILRAKIPYSTIALSRAKRYAGSSKMNFTSLCLHGLGAIGVFLDIIATRLLLLSALLIGFSIVMLLIVTYIRFFTDKAIPGWATTAASSMMIVLLQGFLLSLFTVFLYLSFQGQRRFIPAHHYMDYVQSVETTANG